MATGEIKMLPRRIKLWENQNTTMPAGTVINLLSDDYDQLEVHFKRTSASTGNMYISRFEKGSNINLTLLTVDSSEHSTMNTFIMERQITRNSDIQYTAAVGAIARWNQQFQNGTNFAVPMVIYGIKYS